MPNNLDLKIIHLNNDVRKALSLKPIKQPKSDYISRQIRENRKQLSKKYYLQRPNDSNYELMGVIDSEPAHHATSSRTTFSRKVWFEHETNLAIYCAAAIKYENQIKNQSNYFENSTFINDTFFKLINNQPGLPNPSFGTPRLKRSTAYYLKQQSLSIEDEYTQTLQTLLNTINSVSDKDNGFSDSTAFLSTFAIQQIFVDLMELTNGEKTKAVETALHDLSNGSVLLPYSTLATSMDDKTITIQSAVENQIWETAVAHPFTPRGILTYLKTALNTTDDPEIHDLLQSHIHHFQKKWELPNTEVEQGQNKIARDNFINRNDNFAAIYAECGSQNSLKPKKFIEKFFESSFLKDAFHPIEIKFDVQKLVNVKIFQHVDYAHFIKHQPYADHLNQWQSDPEDNKKSAQTFHDLDEFFTVSCTLVEPNTAQTQMFSPSPSNNGFAKHFSSLLDALPFNHARQLAKEDSNNVTVSSAKNELNNEIKSTKHQLAYLKIMQKKLEKKTRELEQLQSSDDESIVEHYQAAILVAQEINKLL